MDSVLYYSFTLFIYWSGGSRVPKSFIFLFLYLILISILIIFIILFIRQLFIFKIAILFNKIKPGG